MLAELIQEVCQHPPKSPQRRKAMNRLLIEIQKLPKLGKSNSINRLAALNQTLFYVSKNICIKFDYHQPNVEKRFVQWFNKTFHYRLRDSENTSKEDGKIPFQDWMNQDNINLPNRDLLDKHIEKIERKNKEELACKIKNYILDIAFLELMRCT